MHKFAARSGNEEFFDDRIYFRCISVVYRDFARDEELVCHRNNFAYNDALLFSDNVTISRACILLRLPCVRFFDVCIIEMMQFFELVSGIAAFQITSFHYNMFLVFFLEQFNRTSYGECFEFNF